MRSSRRMSNHTCGDKKVIERKRRRRRRRRRKEKKGVHHALSYQTIPRASLLQRPASPNSCKTFCATTSNGSSLFRGASTTVLRTIRGVADTDTATELAVEEHGRRMDAVRRERRTERSSERSLRASTDLEESDEESEALGRIVPCWMPRSRIRSSRRLCACKRQERWLRDDDKPPFGEKRERRFRFTCKSPNRSSTPSLINNSLSTLSFSSLTLIAINRSSTRVSRLTDVEAAGANAGHCDCACVCVYSGSAEIERCPGDG